MKSVGYDDQELLILDKRFDRNGNVGWANRNIKTKHKRSKQLAQELFVDIGLRNKNIEMNSCENSDFGKR